MSDYKKIDKKFTSGLYLRLSKDDERAGESVSIENQRLLLTSFVQEKGWEIGNTYIDDGWSGTNFQRPAFQRMMRDAEDKLINLIIVKDLSRLGRSYIEVGRLTEETLPKLGCRFVALNDSVDTMLGDNDMMVYRNLFNEFYSKDTSKKVRAVKQSCMKQGKYLGTYAPLGYKKDPLNKHHLLVDEDTAPIIRRIFKLRCQGMGHLTITNILNDERVPSPRSVYYQKNGREMTQRTNGLWNKNGVKSILNNECYLGNMVQGKKGTISYKNHTLVSKSEDQWVRVENTHEPLVGREDWETVRSFDNRNFKPREDSEGEVHLFSGLLRCGDCGFNLRAHVQRDKLKDGTVVRRNGYICGNYARSGKAACSVHMIKESVLAGIVMDEIRANAALIAFDEQKVINEIVSGKNRDSMSLNALHRRQLKIYENRLSELDRIVKTLYEDRVNGIITDITFRDMMTDYEQERSNMNVETKELREKIRHCDQTAYDVGAWVKAIRKYAGIEELTREILFELIDKIDVFQTEKIGKQWVCRVRIHYRFVGSVDGTLSESSGSSESEGGERVERRQQAV